MDPKREMGARYLLVAGPLLVALAMVGCDRRDVQPRQESGATDTVILDPAASAADADATMDPLPLPLPPPATSPCAGLSGPQEAQCRARESARRAGDIPATAGDAQAKEQEKQEEQEEELRR